MIWVHVGFFVRVREGFDISVAEQHVKYILMVFFCFLQRQQKLRKERLMNDFSAALNNFQVVQRRAAEKEKESVVRARAGSRVMVTTRLYNS